VKERTMLVGDGQQWERSLAAPHLSWLQVDGRPARAVRRRCSQTLPLLQELSQERSFERVAAGNVIRINKRGFVCGLNDSTTQRAYISRYTLRNHIRQWHLPGCP
jgi:ribosomal protein S14